MKIRYSYLTDTGLVRRNNQDSIFCAANNEIGLFAIADGAGGHSKGEIASGLVVERLDDLWDIICNCDDNFELTCNKIKNTLITANSEIYNKYTFNNEICCTTIALLLIFNNKWMIINCGDSRIYSIRGLRIVKETVDHTYQAFYHCDSTDPRASKLLYAIGSEETCEFFVKTGECKEGSTFVICSDGFYRFVEEKKMRNLILFNNIGKALRKMKSIVIKSNAPDNLSGIVIRI